MKYLLTIFLLVPLNKNLIGTKIINHSAYIIVIPINSTKNINFFNFSQNKIQEKKIKVIFIKPYEQIESDIIVIDNKFPVYLQEQNNEYKLHWIQLDSNRPEIIVIFEYNNYLSYEVVYKSEKFSVKNSANKPKIYHNSHKKIGIGIGTILGLLILRKIYKNIIRNSDKENQSQKNNS